MTNFAERIAKLSPEKRELLLQQLDKSRKETSLLPIRPHKDTATSFPLSFAQQRLWFFDQLVPESAVYNVHVALHLEGRLQVATLERSINAIIKRHEILRTIYRMEDGRPVQVIVPSLVLPVPLVDLQNLQISSSDAHVQLLATQEAQRFFDLAHGPLVRATILRLGKEEHMLLLTMHHIVSDGWSTAVFIRELTILYKAFSTGEIPPLPALPIQYVDFALWQQEWLQGEVLKTQLSYWTQKLEGDLPMLQLPTDRPRPAIQSFRGATQSFTLSANLSNALKILSHQERATLFMALLTAFQTLLYRYTGQDDLLQGTPIANRTQVETEGLIGFFINMLVLRTSISGNPSFRELLRRVREVTLEAYAHQDLPFERLVEELQITRDLSYSPLFQVMFVLQNATEENLQLPGLTIRPQYVDSAVAKFDLTLEVSEASEGLHCSFEYNIDLFDSQTITRMIGHFRTLLEGITTSPDMPITHLPLLTEAEQQRIVYAWNETKTPAPQYRYFHELFEFHAGHTPDRVAVVFEDEYITYQQLNQHANQTAWYLQSLGVGPEVLVGLYLPRSTALVVALLAVLKAGGAYLPLDPSYPAERLAFILHDAQVPLLLTHASLPGQLPAVTGMQGVCLETHAFLIAQQPHSPPPCRLHPHNLAYVIYTSGSTGTPKGTGLAHRGLRNLVLAQTHALPLSPESRVLQGASISFDASVWELVMALARGALLTLAPLQLLSAGHDFTAWLHAQAISVLTLPPSILQALPAAPLPHLHCVIAAGEALPPTVAARWAKAHTLFNAYGPTETTVCASIAPCEPQRLQPITIGRPIANMQLYLLDAALQPVPVGVPGALYIGGEGLARGYLGRPALTAERFRPHPFSPHPGARLYKTGDRARYLADGSLEFLGRLDFQVKVRGFRIELEEIEAVLGQHPAIRESVVLAREYEVGDKRLVAYIVPEPEQTLERSELRRYLKAKLPDYMVPSAFVLLEALPLTHNGKIDHKKLQLPDRSSSEHVFVAPGNSIEETLVQAYAEVLRVGRIGIFDNFFELGGDSILSIQVIDKARQAGVHLTPKQLFLHPTVAELAVVAEALPTKRAEQGIVTGSVPLTPVQHWFFEQKLPEPHYWNQSVLLEGPQALDTNLLKQAVWHVLLHHDALRMRFERKGSGWRQFNTGHDEVVPFTIVDVSALPEEEQQKHIEESAKELQKSLHLTTGPLIRVAFFNLGASKPCRLLLIIHHLVVDTFSWHILLEDLQSAYEQLYRGVAVRLSPKTTSFKWWAEQLEEYARSSALQQESGYWLAESRRRVTRIPVDLPPNEHTNLELSARVVAVALSQKETRALLQEVPRAYRTYIHEVLLTALVQVFAEWTGTRTLLVDLEGHGREEIIANTDLSHTIGWFTTLYPVLLDLADAHEPGEALMIIKEQMHQVPKRGIGYGLLRYGRGDHEISEQLRTLPSAQVNFNYLGQLDTSFPASALFKPARESSGPNHSPLGERSHLLEVSGSVIGEQLHMQWTYSEHVHRSITIEQLAEVYLQKLRELIIHCQSPTAGGHTPSDFPLTKLNEQQFSQLSNLIAEINEAEGYDDENEEY